MGTVLCSSSKMAASEKGMYRVPTYYNSDVPLSLPTCMYSVPNYHKYDSLPKRSDHESPSSEMQSLLKRQEGILSELVEMKVEVERIASKLGVALPTVRTGPPAVDLVVSASPKQPPLSVFAIQHLLCARKNPHSIAVFVHSSLKAQVPPRLAKGFQQVQQGNNKPVPVTITLVWKEVEHGPTMALNPGHCHLHGEATIGRFLCRTLLPDLYAALTVDEVAEVDMWLDVALSRLASGNSKEKALALKTINTQLQKSEWLVGNKMTLADICIASTLVKTNIRAIGSVSQHVETWLKKIPGIST